VRIVCASCNSGWLSGIQNRAKDFLIPLIEGREHVFGIEAQEAIATWAIMATMTGEFTLGNLASIAVSQDDRTALFEKPHPLPDWRVWIGTYRRYRWNGHWVHACMPIMFNGDMIVPNVQESAVPLTNTQWTTVIVGNLYIHTASSSSSPDYIKNWHWESTPRARHLLTQIWPMRETIVKWPTHSLTDIDAWNFATAHFTRLHEKHKEDLAKRPRPSHD
jgi:hypothetical protein